MNEIEEDESDSISINSMTFWWHFVDVLPVKIQTFQRWKWQSLFTKLPFLGIQRFVLFDSKYLEEMEIELSICNVHFFLKLEFVEIEVILIPNWSKWCDLKFRNSVEIFSSISSCVFTNWIAVFKTWITCTHLKLK